jgi:hypothetical protein
MTRNDFHVILSRPFASLRAGCDGEGSQDEGIVPAEILRRASPAQDDVS